MIRSPFVSSFPIVDKDGFPTPAFRDYLLKLGYLIPITGSGSPEGVIDAPQFSLYLDTTGNAQYRKMLTQIGGDPTHGWVLF